MLCIILHCPFPGHCHSRIYCWPPSPLQLLLSLPSQQLPTMQLTQFAWPLPHLSCLYPATLMLFSFSDMSPFLSPQSSPGYLQLIFQVSSQCHISVATSPDAPLYIRLPTILTELFISSCHLAQFWLICYLCNILLKESLFPLLGFKFHNGKDSVDIVHCCIPQCCIPQWLAHRKC